MEIKVLGSMPLWLSRALDEKQIYPASFSKYGYCYENYIVANRGLVSIPSEKQQVA